MAAAQLVGGALAAGAVRILYPGIERDAPDVVVPHDTSTEVLDRVS